MRRCRIFEILVRLGFRVLGWRWFMRGCLGSRYCCYGLAKIRKTVVLSVRRGFNCFWSVGNEKAA